MIGGGHGLSNIVKGFKNEDIDLSVIVSSLDNGGHTGELRKEFDIVAVGDLRMVLSSLFDKGILKELFDYRFTSLHGMKNVSLGNLIITSLLLKYKSMDNVIEVLKSVGNIKADVFLSSYNSLQLCALDSENKVIKGECDIGESNCNIKSLFVDREVVCKESMLNKIREADIIVLCPGSLYTSVGAVLCVEQIRKAINQSKASIVYVCNIMTQSGETLDYSVNDHEGVISSILGRKIDRVIVNCGKVSDDVLYRYKEENSDLVVCNDIKSNYELYDLVEISDSKVIHNSELTKKIILFKDGQNENIVL